MTQRTGLIYKVTNIINHKCYIGQTSQTIGKRKSSHLFNAFNFTVKYHKTYFYSAIRKYGPDNFVWEIVRKDIPIFWLDIWERIEIYLNNSISPNGYNLESGGNANKSISEETKQKISKANTGKNRSETIRNKDSFKSFNRQKSHCIHGHLFNEANTLTGISKNGRYYRFCRECGRNRANQRYKEGKVYQKRGSNF